MSLNVMRFSLLNSNITSCRRTQQLHENKKKIPIMQAASFHI